MKALNMAGGGEYRSKAASKLKRRDVYRPSLAPARKAQMAKKGPLH